MKMDLYTKFVAHQLLAGLLRNEHAKVGRNDRLLSPGLAWAHRGPGMTYDSQLPPTYGHDPDLTLSNQPLTRADPGGSSSGLLVTKTALIEYCLGTRR